MANESDSTSTILATLGTVCWCIQLIPQVIRNWYVRDCEGVPPIMFFLFAVSGIPFAVYFVDQDSNVAFMVQPHLFAFFSFCAFWQSLYYPPVAYSAKKSTIILIVSIAACVGIEVGCILPLRHLYREGTHWPNLIPGIVASVLLAAGLLPPYWELIRRRGQVVGINFLFLFLDSTGAILSMAGVAVQSGSVDILGLVLYIIVFVLEYGILFSHFGWMIWVRYKHVNTEPSAETEKWESMKRAKSHPPMTQPLREWATRNIAIPVGKLIDSHLVRKNVVDDADAITTASSISSQAAGGDKIATTNTIATQL